MNHPWIPAIVAALACACSSEGGGPALSHLLVPQHPFLAPNGRSNMHNDAYMSDSYEIAGPARLDATATVKSYAAGVNTCATVVFDETGRVITTGAEMLSFSIRLIDPLTLESLADYPLPPRDPSDPLFPYDDTSGATYFVLDHAGRVILADAENAVQLLRFDDARSAFELVARFDLRPALAPRTPPSRDHLQMAIPDWSGKYLWFTTRYGRVGTLDPSSGSFRTIDLDGEEIENSFAVGEDGAYIVTDHALYRFSAAADGTPVADWRTEYDRGSRVKPGQFNQGSGTTPHLFDEFVAIADNAEPQMNVLFLRRPDGTTACSVPVFPAGRSGTENALPGFARRGPHGLEYTVFADNNYGIDRSHIQLEGRSWLDHEGGMARIDMRPDGNGSWICEVVWHSPEKSSGVLPKLSLKNGLLYIYTYEHRADGEYDFFLTALDGNSGKRRLRIPTGTGLEAANFGSPMAIGPDGAAYLGTLGGLLRVHDE